MKILITGATGFVGRTLIPYLFSHSLTDICLLVRDRQKAESMFPGLCLEIIATTEGEWCKQVIGYSPDVVIHMATFFTARRDDMSIEKLIGSNILFTTHLLEAVSHTSCSHFINIGTFTEFLNGAGEYLPNNLYSATKTAVRPIIRYYQAQSCWNWINVVVYSPYGRYNSSKKVIDYLVDAVKAEKPVDFSPGNRHCHFLRIIPTQDCDINSRILYTADQLYNIGKIRSTYILISNLIQNIIYLDTCFIRRAVLINLNCSDHLSFLIL